MRAEMEELALCWKGFASFASKRILQGKRPSGSGPWKCSFHKKFVDLEGTCRGAES